MRTIFIVVLSIVIFVTISKSRITSLAQTPVDNCELVTSKLDGIRNIFSNNNSEQMLILIATQGNSERSPLINKRRLYAVKKYLVAMGVTPERIITAQSDKSDRTGKVEIYVEGKLQEVIFAKKNADIPVGSCDNDLEDKKRYQISD